MTPRILLTAAACILLNFGASPVRGAFDVAHIPAERWGTPDAELGLGPGTVEDFEDVFLAPGLEFLLADPSGAFSGAPATTLPGVFDPVAGDPWGDSFEAGVWDGSRVLVNAPGNQSQYYGSSDWRPVMFLVPGGAAWLGMALQQVTINHELVVNGTSLGRLSALGFPLTPQRNGFLLISSDDPRDPIVSVSLGGRGDAFVVDHLVFGANPAVPATPRAFGSVKALFRR
ncbi:hypothetical protein KJ682_15485 [bacterium]|nr:hypothetical protein [bacterium]